jgi:hypothetical protein
MNAMDATFTNGRYELPPHARGVLILADPPEAGRRIQTTSNEDATATAEQHAEGNRIAGKQVPGNHSRPKTSFQT